MNASPAPPSPPSDLPLPRRTFGGPRPSSSASASGSALPGIPGPKRPAPGVSAYSPSSFSHGGRSPSAPGVPGSTPKGVVGSVGGGSFPFLAQTHRRSSSSSSDPRGSSGSIPTTSTLPPIPSGASPSPSLSLASGPPASATPAASPKPFELAADRASAWLSTWAPRGEGRGREFLSNTLSGVANVAGTVGQGIGTTVGHLGSQLREEGLRHQRLSSFSGILDRERERPASAASVESDSALAVSPPSHLHSTGPGPGQGMQAAHAGSTSSLPAGGAAAWQGAGSSPTSTGGSAAQQALQPGLALPVGRKIPQPANIARLSRSGSGSGPNGSGSAAVSPPTGSSARPSLSHPATLTSVPTTSASASNSASSAGSTPTIPRSISTSLAGLSAQPHGPSHLNPNARTSSSTSNLHLHSQHVRAQSFGGTGPSPAMSRTSSGTATPGAGPSNGVGYSWQSRSTGQPYKIGFQPAGARNDRTQEYLAERKGRMVELEKEEGRLGRRWAKLVDLHFNPTMQTIPGQSSPSLPRSASSSRSLAQQQSDKRSSLLGGGALDAWRPREVWKSMKDVAAPVIKPGEEDNRKRAAEQAIVKWEDDNEAKKCRICLASFNLSARKHHCRLCGRIVCSLPPTPPALLAVQVQLFASVSPTSPSGSSTAPLPAGTRREKCSLLLVADYRTYRGEEVDEGFVGWMKLRSPTDPPESTGGGTGAADASPAGSTDGHARPNGNGAAGKGARRRGMSISSIRSGGTASSAGGSMRGEDGLPLPKQAKEVQVKGVRVCRECWTTVSRKQKMADRQRVTSFAKLYALLHQLQAEIEDAMPEFEDAMEILAASDDPDSLTVPTVQLHRNLLALIAQYEHLSKRMSALPVAEGSSQASVQSAVARSAALFLGTQMAKVQALPKLQKQLAAAKRRALPSLPDLVAETTLAGLGAGAAAEKSAEDVALELQPLLEQEAQLESMAEEAKRQRKYEDGKALAAALREIKAEIERVSRGLD